MIINDVELVESSLSPRSPVLQISDSGSRATRTFFCDWDKQFDAIVGLLGFSYVAQQGGVKWIARNLPHGYVIPGHGRETLWVTSVPQIEAVGEPELVAAGVRPTVDFFDVTIYRFAKLTVVYQNTTYEVRPDGDPAVRNLSGPLGASPDEATLARFVTRGKRASNRVVTIPRGIMRWVVGDAPVAGETSVRVMEGVGRSEPGWELTYTHHLRPDEPKIAITRALGCVNSVAFDGYPAGTLLCEPPEITPINFCTGDRAYEIVFRFKFLPKVDKSSTARGHNYFLRYLPNGSIDYRLMTTTGVAGGDKPYTAVDFATLFRPDP